MTVNELVKNGIFKPIALPEPDREISGVYIGDLLSWVMGRAKSGNAWITIMSNINILAVASLADSSCIILAESVMPDNGIVEAAESKGINILSSDSGAYETAILLNNKI